ncbi:MAG: hypothetical protein L6R37_005061 [Teloschistes peruensis]|nr:MAG: hypothetical protein L6R37_005061 [Teloschistes peruensis]
MSPRVARPSSWTAYLQSEIAKGAIRTRDDERAADRRFLLLGIEEFYDAGVTKRAASPQPLSGAADPTASGQQVAGPSTFAAPHHQEFPTAAAPTTVYGQKALTPTFPAIPQHHLEAAAPMASYQQPQAGLRFPLPPTPPRQEDFLLAAVQLAYYQQAAGFPSSFYAAPQYHHHPGAAVPTAPYERVWSLAPPLPPHQEFSPPAVQPGFYQEVEWVPTHPLPPPPPPHSWFPDGANDFTAVLSSSFPAPPPSDY